MKLSPPASFSDLELARGIARRLSRLASPGEGEEARPLPPYTPFPAARPAEKAHERPVEPRRAEARPAPTPVANPETLRVARPPAAEPAPAAKPAAPPPRPAPPPLAVSAPAPQSAPPAPAGEGLGVLPDEQAPPPPPPPARAAAPRPTTPPPPPVAPVEAEAEIDVDTEAREDIQDVDFEAEARAAADAEPVAEIVAEGEATPSWAEILQDCLYLARASGALLIDGQGEVAASCGDWPDPGVEVIAARLVPAMDKALQAAPTRSVSVPIRTPIGVLHLTAWRVPVGEALVTVGFVADAALKAEVRPAIDAEVRRGATA